MPAIAITRHTLMGNSIRYERRVDAERAARWLRHITPCHTLRHCLHWLRHIYRDVIATPLMPPLRHISFRHCRLRRQPWRYVIRYSRLAPLFLFIFTIMIAYADAIAATITLPLYGDAAFFRYATLPPLPSPLLRLFSSPRLRRHAAATPRRHFAMAAASPLLRHTPSERQYLLLRHYDYADMLTLRTLMPLLPPCRRHTPLPPYTCRCCHAVMPCYARLLIAMLYHFRRRVAAAAAGRYAPLPPLRHMRIFHVTEMLTLCRYVIAITTQYYYATLRHMIFTPADSLYAYTVLIPPLRQRDGLPLELATEDTSHITPLLLLATYITIMPAFSLRC